MLAKERPGPAGIARLTLYAAGGGGAERTGRDASLSRGGDADGSPSTRRESAGRAAHHSGGSALQVAAAAADRRDSCVSGDRFYANIQTPEAGDLWLQVHGYQEAWQSYVTASQQVGPVLRVLAGIACATARLNNAASACGAFRSLVEEWGVRQAEPPEISEARAYLRRPACMTAGP